ncbi:MAG: SLC13 family permease [Planctomycetota bacterium]|nr:SLC13 family permease [Planctomycetota bacterium]
MPTEAYIVLAILAASLVLFVTDALRYDLIAVGVLVTLVLTDCLDAEEALHGFSNEAVALIASMYVFGHAFARSGVAEAIGNRFLGSGPGAQSETSIVIRLSLVAGLCSAVLSNTGVVATLIPVCVSLGKRHRIPVSRLLMPMAFASLLGGLVTVIGTSNNVVINGRLQDLHIPPFELFEFSHYGLILVAVGTLYMFWPGRQLLPRSPVDQSLTDRYQVPKFMTEVLVEPTSTLINRNVADLSLFEEYQVTVLGIVRAGGEQSVMAPGPYNRIRSNDTLILQGSPEDLLRLGEVLPLKERKSVETDESRLYSDDVRLVEGVVPAVSSFVGQTLTTSEFRTRTGLNVMAIAKHGEVQLRRLQETELEVGDTLLVQGHSRDVERARRERELLILDEIEGARPTSGSAWLAVGILAAVLLAAALNLADLGVLALAGALLLVLTRLVRPEEVYRVMDWPVLVMIGGMLALGSAFEKHGLSAAVATWIKDLGQEGITPSTLLLVLLATTTLLTQVLNHVTTAVIMTDVAVELAKATEVDARPFLMAVVTGSSLCFLSPVAHQAGAMVMGPGGYSYRDFIRAGTPLAVLCLVVGWILIPWFWPFYPG